MMSDPEATVVSYPLERGGCAPPVNALPLPALAGVEHRFCTVDGVRTHYAEAGEGEPLLLLHGWPQHWWSWRELIGPLSERYRVICPDARGMGWTHAPRSGYSLRRMADDLLGLLDVLGLSRVRLVGHDWGLVTGYRACLDRPDRFERFIPMGGIHVWTASGGPPRLYVRPWHVFLLATPLGSFCTRRLGIPEVALRTWRHAGSFTDAEKEIYLAPLRCAGAARATMLRDRAIATGDVPHFFLRHRSERLRVPTLHLNGDHDPLTAGTPDSYRRFADDMRLELVPDCGHFLPEERPGWVLDRIADFLR